MRKILSLMICVVIGCNSQPADRKEPTTVSNIPTVNGKDPREELNTAVAEALLQLENKEYERFVADFMTPAEKRQLVGLKIAEIGKVIQPLAEGLIGQLQGAQLIPPVLEDDGTLARFRNANMDGRDLVFEKTGRYWYISGHESHAEGDGSMKKSAKE